MRDVERMQRDRIVLFAGVLLVFMSAILGSCVYLQGCEHTAFVEEAERNYLRRLSLDTQRGDIYDRNGEALATSVEVETVYTNPRRVVDPIDAAEQLSRVLELDQELLMRRLTSASHFRYLKRQVTAEEAEAVRLLDLEGIELSREAKRFYPKKELAGQLLGVVGFDSRGREGLEATYDHILRGGQLEARYHRDATGRYAMLEALPPVETRAGHSLQVTLDEKIQEVCERELERACLSSLARAGVAVVMDVETGDVLAMAHWPRFNPNRYREQIAEDRVVAQTGRAVVQRFRNRVITDMFEPGSTFKIFTLAAGLEEGVVGLDDKLDLEGGRYKVGRKWISDTHRFDERRSVADVIKYSSNIGVIKIGQMLGRDRLHDYLWRFGFGQPSGVNVMGDSPGLLRPPRQWAEITLANVAFGQGVAVTALQLTAALAAIGNGGVLMRPRVVMAELDSDGAVLRRFPPQAQRRVVSATTARAVLKAMMGVVEHDGTGPLAWIYDYEVAGKTGTAQKPDTIAGGYAEDRWVASFVGLAPVRKPRLAVLVAVDEPRGQYYGGVVAAPAFKAIAEWTLNYLGVPPSYGSREHVGRDAVVQRYGQPHVSAEGAYYDWPPDRQPGVDPEIPLVITVPDFADLHIRAAAETAHQGFLILDIDGSGLAAGQSLSPGTRVAPWTRVTVYFRPGESDSRVGDEEGGP